MTPHPERCPRLLGDGAPCGRKPSRKSAVGYCPRHRWEAIHSPVGKRVGHIVRAMREDTEDPPCD